MLQVSALIEEKAVLQRERTRMEEGNRNLEANEKELRHRYEELEAKEGQLQVPRPIPECT